jgi:N-methylhydantoinase B/oxoprolinase/acetone carboxylase alpha subunit
MNPLLHISITLHQPGLLENLVEKLAYRRYETGYGKEKMPEGWAALETSSTEAYVCGTMALDFTGTHETSEEHINMPFITSFLFTCIKGEKEPYQLIWSTSLS